MTVAIFLKANVLFEFNSTPDASTRVYIANARYDFKSTLRGEENTSGRVTYKSHLKHSSRQREAWPGLELMLKACNEEVEKHYRAPNNAAFNLFSQRCSFTCLASIAFQVYA